MTNDEAQDIFATGAIAGTLMRSEIALDRVRPIADDDGVVTNAMLVRFKPFNAWYRVTVERVVEG